jgi:hypothetical protein
MALLTEEQIQDLYLQLDNVSSTSAMQTVIKEWNKKQPSTQLEPDWDNAPEKATQAVVNSFWVDANGDTFGVYKTYYDRPKPVITPHPHASLMTKYAEVAQRRRDPWVEFEHKCDDLDDSYWIQCDMFIGFHADYFYRHIGDDK